MQLEILYNQSLMTGEKMYYVYSKNFGEKLLPDVSPSVTFAPFSVT
jgi:hypothetical protein